MAQPPGPRHLTGAAKRRVAALAGVAMALVICYVVVRDGSSSRSRGSGPAPPVHGSATAPPGATQVPSRIHRFASSAERARFVERIAEAATARDEVARAAGAARAGAAARPELPASDAGALDVEHTPMPVKEALEAAIPILADCYPKTGAKVRQAGVVMSLTGDPAVGTVIDADQMSDPDGRPLDPALDACLRETLRSLELPPLDEGTSLKLQYTFAFDDDGARAP